MKKNFAFIIIVLLVAGCNEQRSELRSFDPQTIFSVDDARLILGGLVNTKQGSTGIDAEGLASCLLKYAAIEGDSAGRKSSLTFKYDEFASVTVAENAYAAIKKAYEQNKGVKIIEHIGDEAYFNSDDSTFYYLLARKNNKTFHISVSPITSTTSLDEFYKVAKRVADSL
jgi:hypothetical protein